MGDWNGNGTDTFGVVRRGVWYIANYFDAGVAETVFGYGNPDDTPTVGDWDDDGAATAGIIRDGQWYITDTLGAEHRRRATSTSATPATCPVPGADPASIEPDDLAPTVRPGRRRDSWPSSGRPEGGAGPETVAEAERCSSSSPP